MTHGYDLGTKKKGKIQNMKELLEALREAGGSAGPNELARRLGWERSRVLRALYKREDSLVRLGLVARTERGKYEATNIARQARNEDEITLLLLRRLVDTALEK